MAMCPGHVLFSALDTYKLVVFGDCLLANNRAACCLEIRMREHYYWACSMHYQLVLLSSVFEELEITTAMAKEVYSRVRRTDARERCELMLVGIINMIMEMNSELYKVKKAASLSCGNSLGLEQAEDWKASVSYWRS